MSFSSSNSSSSSECGINALLISKFMFAKYNHDTGRVMRLLNLIFITRYGTTIDVKTKWFQTSKAYSVYMLVEENHWYTIKNSGDLEEPDSEFSTSDYVIDNDDWWIEELPRPLSLNRKLACKVSINNSLEKNYNHGKPVNIMGRFCGLRRGPATGPRRNGELTIQGYYITLRDNNQVQYQALIWHNQVLDENKEHPIFRSRVGDKILLVASRKTWSPSDEDDKITVTTLVQPVCNPKFVTKQMIDMLD